MSVAKVCVRCGVGFQGESRATYCTRECFHAVRSERFAAAPRRVATCVGCGSTYSPTRKRSKYCGQGCYARSTAVVTPITTAVEGGDYSAVLRLVRERAVIDATGCHIWQGTTTGPGYAVVNVRRKKMAVHRLVAGAVSGTDLPRHLPVHHRCANRRCVNPDHLQVTTVADNNAEMMSRNALLSEIAELRAVIAAELGADHPSLRRPHIEGLVR